MAAVAGPARHHGFGVIGFTRLFDLADVILVDVHHHPVHQPRRVLLRLGVIGEVQRPPAVRHFFVRIRGMAGCAFRSQFGFPLVHQLVHLLPRHVLGKHFQIGRGGLVMMVVLRSAARLPLLRFMRLSGGCKGQGGKGNC